MAYADPSDMISRKDARLLGDLVSDNGVQVSPGGLATDLVLQTMLDDASGAVDAALLVGARYTPAQLTGLTGNALNHLKRVTCDIAFSYLVGRRSTGSAEQDKAARELAEDHLKRLQDGENVFYLEDVLAATVPDTTGPTVVEYQNMNLLRDRVRNYYPGRVPTVNG